MAMMSGSHDRDCRVDLTPAVSLFRSLGDPTRLAIVHELAKGERRVVDLTRHLGLAQSTVSAHLALMRGSGVVQSRTLGRQSLYRLSRPQLFAVLSAAESWLAASGYGVELCPRSYTPSGDAQLMHDDSSSQSQPTSAVSSGDPAITDGAGDDAPVSDSAGRVRDSAGRVRDSAGRARDSTIPAHVADVAAA